MDPCRALYGREPGGTTAVHLGLMALPLHAVRAAGRGRGDPRRAGQDPRHLPHPHLAHPGLGHVLVAGRPYGWADVPDGAGDAGSLAVGDAADGEGPGPDSVGDDVGLVGDGVGEWLVRRGVGVGVGVCAGVCVAAGVVTGDADPVATGLGRTHR